MLSTEQRETLFQIGYEWWMFQSLEYHLSELDGFVNDPIRNALLESMVLHARSLIEFFKGKPQNDDLRASVFGLPSVNLTGDIESFYLASHKHIAHLTAMRAHKKKEWNIEPIHTWIANQIQLIKTNVGVDFPEDWPGDMSHASSLLKTRNPVKHLYVTGPTGAAGPRK